MENVKMWSHNVGTQDGGVVAMVKRGRTGTVLGIIDILGLVFTGLLTLIFLLPLLGMGSMMEWLMPAEALPIIGMVWFLGSFVLLPLILAFVLGFFVTRGVFKWQRWAIVLSMIFTILALIGGLVQFAVISIVFHLILLVLEISCLKDPYYANKN